MLANSITIARIALVPFVLWVVFAEPERTSNLRWLAVLLFVASAATDSLDGAIARRRGEVTNLGKILDPIADKLLIGGTMVALSWLGNLDWWITGVVLFRELAITVYRLVVVKKRVIAASGLGKAKTVIQTVAVAFVLSPSAWLFGAFQSVLEVGLWSLAILFTVWSAADYVIKAVKR